MKHFTREFLTSSVVTLLLTSLLHVSCAAAPPPAPPEPQSTISIATAIIMIVMIAVVVAVSGFVAIRKGEKP